jgi:uncharacterized protein (DUF1499 family)
MGLVRWFTRNSANTRDPSHPDLRPLDLPQPAADAVAAVEKLVAGLRGWRVAGRGAGELHLTRRTRVFRFVDDVRLTFEPTPAGCRVHAESRSRVGTGDLGQNRRNVRELWAAVMRHHA